MAEPVDAKLPTEATQAPSAPRPEVPSPKLSVTDRLRAIGRWLSSESDFKPEDYTQGAIASDIFHTIKNPLLEQRGEDPYQNGFGKRDVLSNKGQVRNMGNPDSPAYQAASQTLESMVRDGILEDMSDPEGLHDENRFYRVIDPQRLEQMAEEFDASQTAE